MLQTSTQSPKQHSPEVICSKVEKLYGFFSLDLPGLINGGTECAAWHFRTDTGDWIAKVYIPYEGLFGRVAEETLLYDYLISYGINVPRVLRSKRGQRIEKLTVGMNEYPLMVMKHENLRYAYPASIQKEELLKIAQTVARMHQYLKLYPGQRTLMIKDKTTLGNLVIVLLKNISRTAANMYKSLRGDLSSDNLTALKKPVGYEVLAVSPIADSFSSEELSRIEVIDRKMKAYIDAHPTSSRLTKSFIHGDLALEHTPLLPTGDVYLYDFADYSWGPVAEDLAKMLERLYAMDDITFDRWEELKDWILTEYRATSFMTQDDLAAISPFMMRALLVKITYRCNMSRKLQGEAHSRCVERRYRLADYLLRTIEIPPGN